MTDGGLDDAGVGNVQDAPSGSAPGSSAPGGPQRLYREPEDKKLAGVCGGLADYFGLDPVVVRLAAVVIGVATGFAGVVAYIVATVVIPLRPETVTRVQAPPRTFQGGVVKNNGLMIGLLIVALLVAVGGQWSWWWFEPPAFGLILVALGVYLLMSREERPRKETFSNLATGSAERTTLVGRTAPVGDRRDDPWTTVSSSESDHSAGPRGELAPPIPPWGPSSPPARSSQRFSAGVLAVLLMVAGVVALFAVLGVWDLSFQEALGVGLLVIGAGLIIGAWRGRARPLLALGLPALGVLVLADTVNLPLDGGVGERRIVVTTLTELQNLDDQEELLAGELVVDLSAAPLGRPGAPTQELDLDVGFGKLEVWLPEDATSEIAVDVGVGSSHIDGREENGFDVERSEIRDGQPGGGDIELDLHMGVGQVRVFHG